MQKCIQISNLYYPFLTLGEAPWNFRKKVRHETFKNEVFRKSILTPPPTETPPPSPWGSDRAHLSLYVLVCSAFWQRVCFYFVKIIITYLSLFILSLMDTATCFAWSAIIVCMKTKESIKKCWSNKQVEHKEISQDYNFYRNNVEFLRGH